MLGQTCYWIYTLTLKTSSMLPPHHCITQTLIPCSRMIFFFIYYQNSCPPKYLYLKFIFSILFCISHYSFLLLISVFDYFHLQWINLNYYWNEVNAPWQSLMFWMIMFARQQSLNWSQPYLLFTFKDYCSKVGVMARVAA